MDGKSGVAVIDVGSNTIKMLLAKLDENGLLRVIEEQTLEVRISEGLTASQHQLMDSAMRKGASAVALLNSQAKSYGAEEVHIIATSAVREAENGAIFCRYVREMTEGLECRILSGVEEASYIAQGVQLDPQLPAVEDLLVMDLGGGSLELIRMVQGKILMKRSVPLGAVRMMNQFISSPDQPVRPAEIEAMDHFIQSVLVDLFSSISNPPLAVIGTGGAVTHLRLALAHEQHCELSDTDVFIGITAIDRMYEALAGLNASERLTLGIPEKRVDIMPSALRIILHVLRQAQAKGLSHSFYNLRYGYAHEILTQI